MKPLVAHVLSLFSCRRGRRRPSTASTLLDPPHRRGHPRFRRPRLRPAARFRRVGHRSAPVAVSPDGKRAAVLGCSPSSVPDPSRVRVSIVDLEQPRELHRVELGVGPCPPELACVRRGAGSPSKPPNRRRHSSSKRLRAASSAPPRPMNGQTRKRPFRPRPSSSDSIGAVQQFLSSGGRLSGLALTSTMPRAVCHACTPDRFRGFGGRASARPRNSCRFHPAPQPPACLSSNTIVPSGAPGRRSALHFQGPRRISAGSAKRHHQRERDMGRQETFYELIRRQGISRRNFMKFCSLSAASLGLAPAFARQDRPRDGNQAARSGDLAARPRVHLLHRELHPLGAPAGQGRDPVDDLARLRRHDHGRRRPPGRAVPSKTSSATTRASTSWRSKATRRSATTARSASRAAVRSSRS